MVISKGVNRVDEFWADDTESHSGGSNSSNSGNGADKYGHGDGSLCSHPLRLVVMRAPPSPPPPRVPNKEVHVREFINHFLFLRRVVNSSLKLLPFVDAKRRTRTCVKQARTSQY